LKTHNRNAAESLTEISLLTKADCIHVAERFKDVFNYPLHKHTELEMNFVMGGEGLIRVVGDNSERIGNLDLALVGGGLEHEWMQPEDFKPHQMREVTIQFSPSLLSDELLGKEHFASIRRLIENAKRGISFSETAIKTAQSKLDMLCHMESGFYRFMVFLEMLYLLSQDENSHILATEEFSNAEITTDSSRIRQATEYINTHFREEIRLQDLANLVCMTPTAFSRFFSLRTHKTVSDYIIDQRLGYASRQLLDGSQTVIEICYECGFNNVSNFNRLFKKRKGVTPTQFREYYRKHRILSAEASEMINNPSGKIGEDK